MRFILIIFIILLSSYSRAKENSLISNETTNSSFSVYVEVDYGMYQHFGSISAVENFVESIFSQVASIYHREELILTISEVRVLTSCGNAANPCYSSTTTNSALNAFKSARPSFNGDIACLLVKSEINNSGAAGEALAYGDRPSLCLNQSSESPYTVNIIQPNFVTFPNYSRSVNVIAHEIGHILSGVTHTSNSECGIMSYCDLDGSTPSTFYNGFIYERGEIIRDAVAYSTCDLDICTTQYENISLSSNVASGVLDAKIATGTINITNKIYSGGVANYSAGNSLVFKTGFRAYKGASLHSFISSCELNNLNNRITSNIIISEDEVNGINGLTEFNIFPNPTLSNLTIVNNEFDDGDKFNISIYDLNGKLMYYRKGIEERSFDINTLDWKRGTYYGQIQNENLSTFKLIKE